MPTQSNNHNHTRNRYDNFQNQHHDVEDPGGRRAQFSQRRRFDSSGSARNAFSHVAHIRNIPNESGDANANVNVNVTSSNTIPNKELPPHAIPKHQHHSSSKHTSPPHAHSHAHAEGSGSMKYTSLANANTAPGVRVPKLPNSFPPKNSLPYRSPPQPYPSPGREYSNQSNQSSTSQPNQFESSFLAGNQILDEDYDAYFRANAAYQNRGAADIPAKRSETQALLHQTSSGHPSHPMTMNGTLADHPYPANYDSTTYNDIALFSQMAGGGGYDPVSPNSLDKNNGFHNNNHHQVIEVHKHHFHSHQVVEHHSMLRHPFIFFREHIYKKLLYNHENPEFTSLQQSVWAVIIGVFMGFATAYWSALVEYLIDLVWVDFPERLLEWGVFTDLNGRLPLPHYMWICPAFFGGLLAFITSMLSKPIPGQNEWIDSLHRTGLMEYDTIVNIFVISTLGMASGLNLGPELPLVLTSGMVGSIVAKFTRQSVLSTRVMNLTAASAGIAGFFGMPMGGALFVLELPHQQGLQYFEAMNSGILASIFAVVTNRIVSQNDVTGIFNYPFLTSTLPSRIFWVAIVYGIVGALVGMFYTKGVIFLKTFTHDLWHYHEDHHDDHHEEDEDSKFSLNIESVPLTGKKRVLKKKGKSCLQKITSCHIKNEPFRATIVGVLAGAITGVICMFLPILLFWGEAQLQTLIDNGTTPLPVFGRGAEPTAHMTAYGYCMPNEDNDQMFSIACSALFTAGKTACIGLSVGTGIVGGHFWGPLYAGAAGANLFTGIVRYLTRRYRILDGYAFFYELSQYPCLAVICIMGSSHVATFKALISIMLILILSIKSFIPGGASDLNTSSDYAAIFPLLVVSCFVAINVSKGTLFYKKQTYRGDLIVTEQTLCEPGKYGQVIAHDDDDDDDLDEDDYSNSSMGSGSTQSALDFVNQRYGDGGSFNGSAMTATQKTVIKTDITGDDIEQNFNLMLSNNTFQPPNNTSGYDEFDHSIHSRNSSSGALSPLQNEIAYRKDSGTSDISSVGHTVYSTEAGSAMAQIPRPAPKHRRIRSEDPKTFMRFNNSKPEMSRSRSNSVARNRADSRDTGRRRLDSFGEITDKDRQPSLLDQARMRAASKADDDSQSNIPKLPRAQRRRASLNGPVGPINGANNQHISSEFAGGMPSEDIERALSSVQMQENLG